jgi:hypothetical protein
MDSDILFFKSFHLSQIVRRGLRTLFLCELTAVLMFVGYMAQPWVVPTASNTFTDRMIFGLNMAFHACNLFAVFFCVKVPEVASFFNLFIATSSALNCIVDCYNIFYICTTPSLVYTLVIAITFLFLDFTYVVLSLYIFLNTPTALWTAFIADSRHYNFLDLYVISTAQIEAIKRHDAIVRKLNRIRYESGLVYGAEIDTAAGSRETRPYLDGDPDDEYYNGEKNVTDETIHKVLAHEYNLGVFKPGVLRGLVATILPVELTILYFYVVTMLSSPVTNAVITGWMYGLQILTIGAALATSSRLCVTRANAIRAYSKLFSFSFMLVLMESVQLYVIGPTGDAGILIAMRGLLLGCLIAYILSIIFSQVEFDTPDHAEILFYSMQYVVYSLAVTDLFFTSFYFLFVSAAAATFPIVWSNLLHLFSSGSAIASIAWTAGEGGSAGIALLGISATIVLLYDSIVVGTVGTVWLPLPSGSGGAAEYVPQVSLLIISFLYVIVAVVCQAQVYMDPDCVYRYDALIESEKLSRRHWMQLFGFTAGGGRGAALAAPVTAQERQDFRAYRMYFYISYVLRVIFLMDLTLLIYFILVLVLNSNIVWYAWFYLLHFLTTVSAFMLMLLLFDMKLIYTFLTVSTIICLIADIVLIIVLQVVAPPYMRLPALTAFQSLFIATDVFYVVFLAVSQSRADPALYVRLLLIPSVSKRLHLGIRNLLPDASYTRDISKSK